MCSNKLKLTCKRYVPGKLLEENRRDLYILLLIFTKNRGSKGVLSLRNISRADTKFRSVNDARIFVEILCSVIVKYKYTLLLNSLNLKENKQLYRI